MRVSGHLGLKSLPRVADAEVFDALKSCIDARGFGKFTMADVAAECGLSRVQIYNRFRSRNDLLLAFLTDHVTAYKVRATQQLLESEELPAAIVTYFLNSTIAATRDTYFRMLIIPAISGQFHVNGAAEATLAVGRRQWMPVLERGIAMGLMKPDLSTKMAADWLTFSEMTLLNAVQNYEKTPADCAAYARAFLLPALLKEGTGSCQR